MLPSHPPHSAAVSYPQVRVLFGERSLEMWAVGQAAAYHLHLPRLYGRLIAHKCSVKVSTVSGCGGCGVVCVDVVGRCGGRVFCRVAGLKLLLLMLMTARQSSRCGIPRPRLS